MGNDDSRREFLKWIGTGAGAAALSGLGAGCTGPDPSISDTGGGADVRDGSGMGGDSGTDGGADVAPETGPDSGDADGGGSDTDGESTCEETGSDVEGPFHAEGAPERQKLAPDDEPGRRIHIEGTVYESDCRTPVEGAMLDVWHANKDGDYYDASDNFRLRGQLKTDANGNYEIRTIKPGNYPAAGGLRPAHVHFTITSPQFEPLTTQMYFTGDPQLQNDPCGGCSSDDSTLIVDFSKEMRNGEEILVGQFDIILG